MTHEQEIDLTHIQNKAHQEKVLNLLRNYKPNKAKKIDVKMNIRLTSDIPIHSSLRRFSFIEKEIINEQMAQWLKDKIIRPNTSEYSSPAVLVKKKDGSSRLSIDYRRLNKITVREHFPLLLIDDLLDRLQSANVFTTLDLRNTFFHVDNDPSSKKYTSFLTNTGQYKFNKMSFGPCVFQRYIYNVFRDRIKENVVMIYLNDLVIFSENETQGIERLQRDLKTASEYGLELNIKKGQFFKREIELLCHRIKDASKKQGKQEGELHPIPKVELPLDTYHIDHLGPLESTNKNYKYILCVIDSFTKFVWLYPTKSTSSQEVISKLEPQKSVFGNPRRVISDKGSPFNSKEFDDYCSSESILSVQHLSVATDLPRANGQVERLNSTVYSMTGQEANRDYAVLPALHR
ncbi:Transposon Ty3-G Gag-Pol polyprotein [Araneus ventricosus]|uniref:Transposon Ty3-G Gag-Pol polyprotein n=1 Tax=Araneus ventricosus TaxID=182803 RepID=A0A4Y2CPI8_ARAVE|nr:Transposon Ty3-G Gag-Pol polyprotein [Araneus ventricosus]